MSTLALFSPTTPYAVTGSYGFIQPLLGAAGNTLHRSSDCEGKALLPRTSLMSIVVLSVQTIVREV